MKLVLGILAGTAFLYVLVSLLWCPYCNGKESAKAYACLSNTKRQALGLIVYASENDERFARRDYWMDSIRPFVRSSDVFFHPGPVPRGLGYAFNASLSTAREPKRPESVPMVYDSVNPIRNASDRFASLPRPGRHDGKNSVAYADGHAKRVAMEAGK